MIILTIRTDKEEAELGLYENSEELAYIRWQAHRQLAETIHKKLQEMLNKSSISTKELGGIVCYKGPGSFTGLRIGLSSANALAYGLQIPIVSKKGEKWRVEGTKALLAGDDEKIVKPFYSGTAKVTKPRK